MKELENNKGIILLGLLILGGVFFYQSFFAPPSTVTDVTSEGVGKTVVDLYQSLQSVNLDTNLFTMPAYRALTDFSTPLTPLPIGRRNPFDKI